AKQTGDDSSAGAVNASVARIRVNRMVEDVEELRLELSLDALSDGEILKEGHVRHQLSRSCELIATDGTELGNARCGEGTTLRNDGRAVRPTAPAVRTVAKCS